MGMLISEKKGNITMTISANELNELLKKAQSGCKYSCYKYAKKCQENRISNSNAWHYIAKAAEKGHIRAMDDMAYLHKHIGDLEEATRWENKLKEAKDKRMGQFFPIGAIIGGILGLAGGFWWCIIGAFIGGSITGGLGEKFD